jgi:uridine phosphorylase
LRDYSITSPHIFIENRARSKGVSPEVYHVPKLIMVFFDRSELQRFVELTNASLVDWVISSTFCPFYEGYVEKKKIGLIFLGWGASTVVARLEVLIACGAKVIIASGAVGTFQAQIDIGDFIIPTEALIGEGTSQYYLPNKKVVSADPGIVKILEEACKRIDVKSFLGSVWTTDAIYREMQSKVEELQGQGVLGVEMETSALYSVASFRKIKAGCLLRVSDSLANFKWDPHFWSERYIKMNLETSPKILLIAIKLFLKQGD